MIEESVYVESGRRPITSETSRLLDNVTNRLRRNKQRQEQLASVELDARYSKAHTLSIMKMKWKKSGKQHFIHVFSWVHETDVEKQLDFMYVHTASLGISDLFLHSLLMLFQAL